LRLLNSNNSPFSGRVEVLYRGTWGTICGHYWDLQDADVVCRQLGYDGAISAPKNAVFGQGIGPIWLDNVQCVGNETSITQCNHRGWGVENCRHNQDAGVVCRPSDESRAQALQCPSLVTEGSSVHLQCIAIGNPPPNITWIWKGTGDVLGGNEQLILFDVHRNQAGTYQCHAWNGIGNGSISTCRLDVL
ncbi:scavenger receptor cysteine-rich domain-containing group B protein-like, partial [Stylophora pistillata]|uniref:scavenger receptor cysteine-rich domain-containing group B protein-like n=1 Tax=Stylophora pistillata TaxID=50429 RepID=UPI000C04101B